MKPNHELVAYLFVITSIMTLTSACTSQLPSEVADTVYTNGKIYTVNEAQPWAEAVAIKDGKFLVVGSNADVETVTGDGTEVVDLTGQFVMPGIVDMHAHPFTGVDMGIGGINLSSPGDLEAVLADIKQFVAEHPDRDVFLGGNWSIGGALFENDSADKIWKRFWLTLSSLSPNTPTETFFSAATGASAARCSKTTARTRRCWTRSCPMFRSSFLARAVTRPG